MKIYFKNFILLFLIAIPLIGSASSHNLVVSISSDGNYIVSSNDDNQLILWNVANKKYSIISNGVNPYSPYFIKDTQDFIFQKNLEVIVENVNGKIVKKFKPGFKTYGQVMTSNLQNWIGVDNNDQIFLISEGHTQQLLYHFCQTYGGEPYPDPNKNYYCGSFSDQKKLFDLALSSDNIYLAASGYGEVFIWNLKTKNLIQHIQNNLSQTYSVFNPESTSLLIGDIQSQGYVVNLLKNVIKGFTYEQPQRSEIQTYTNYDSDNNLSQILSMKFIDADHVLVFYQGTPIPFNYGALYNFKSIQSVFSPIKYLPLSIHPLKFDDPESPAIQDPTREQAIDASVSGHILVIAMNNANGILVYKYDPQAQTLTNIWSPQVSWWKSWF